MSPSPLASANFLFFWTRVRVNDLTGPSGGVVDSVHHGARYASFYLKQLQRLFPNALEPVLEIAWDEDAFMLTKLAQDDLVVSVEPHAAAKDHPEPIDAGMRVEVVLSTLSHKLNRGNQDV